MVGWFGAGTAVEALLLLELWMVDAVEAPFPTSRFIYFHLAANDSCDNQIFRRFPVTILEPYLAYKSYFHISSLKNSQSTWLVLRQ